MKCKKLCNLLYVTTETKYCAIVLGNRRNSDCSEWERSGECVPNQGTCGKGRVLATRTGDNCRVTEKQLKCEVPCEGEASPSGELALMPCLQTVVRYLPPCKV